MKTLFGAAVLSLAFLIVPSAGAAEKATAEEAIAMTKRAVALLQSVGSDKAFAQFANPGSTSFHDRDLYIYVYDMDGVCVAHGTNRRMVGRNLRDMRDSDGKLIIQAFIQIANGPGSGWVDYKWLNPVNSAIERKAGYIERHGNLIVGSGIYK